MDKEQVIRDAECSIQDRVRVYPSNDMYVSIQRQLSYVREVISGKNEDRSRLKDIIVGHYAVREIGDEDPELADLLKKVQYIVDQTRKGLKV
jgi:hypothetical protein